MERLSNLTKEIWAVAEKAGVILRAQWVPREENTYADELSKRWEQWFKLSPQTEQKVRGLIASLNPKPKVDPTIVNVPFNQIANAVQSVRAERGTACIIHPSWPAQSWWPVIRSAAINRWNIGSVEDALTPHNSALPPPRWNLLASVVAFDQ